MTKGNQQNSSSIRIAPTIYYEECGPGYTDMTVNAAVERAKELNLGFIVIGSTTGYSAMKLFEACNNQNWNGQLVVVTEHVGYHAPGHQAFDEETRRLLIGRGVLIHTGTHAFSSITRSFRQRWQGIEMLEIVAETLRRISRGFKTAVEVTIMAADAGFIPVDKDVVAIGGTGKGADTAVVLRPTSMNHFFDLKVREFICLPQRRSVELEPTDLSSPEAIPRG